MATSNEELMVMRELLLNREHQSNKGLSCRAGQSRAGHGSQNRVESSSCLGSPERVCKELG